MTLHNPLSYLGVTPELAAKLDTREVGILIHRQVKQLRALFHPDGTIPDEQLYACIATAIDDITTQGPTRLYDLLQELKKPLKGKVAAKMNAEMQRSIQLQRDVDSLRTNFMAYILANLGVKFHDTSTNHRNTIFAKDIPSGTNLFMQNTMQFDNTSVLKASLANTYTIEVLPDHHLRKIRYVSVRKDEITDFDTDLASGIIIKKGPHNFIKKINDDSALDSVTLIGSMALPSESAKNIRGLLDVREESTEATELFRTGFEFDDIAPYISHLEPELKDNNYLLGARVQDNTLRFLFLGKILRMQHPHNTIRPEKMTKKKSRIPVAAQKGDNDVVTINDGIFYSTEMNITYTGNTIEAFAKKHTCDFNQLSSEVQSAIKDGRLSPIRNYTFVDNTKKPLEVFWEHELMPLLQNFTTTGTVNLTYSELRPATTAEAFLEICKYRTPPMYSADLYRMMEAKKIKFAKHVSAAQQKVRNDEIVWVNKEVFWVTDLEEIYNDFKQNK